MERFSQRDNVLVDYSNRSPKREVLGHGFLPKNLYRNSDVDFNDVFGGPPRRSSVHEMKYSLSEAADSYGYSRRGEIPPHRNPWTGENEKPVFGEENTGRRRFMSEDFFDDIFRGSESASSTPRKHDRDVFSTSPGSWAMSPVRPLPPRAKPLLSSSVPSQFSLPVTMSKPVDSSALHPRSPKVSILGYPSRMTQVQDASKVVIQSSYCPSPLSHEFSLSGDKILNASKSDKVHNSNKGADQDMPSSAQFHFSIYKWASKGIPLVMPLRRANSSKSKERVKTESSNGNEKIDSQNRTVELASPSAEKIDSFSLKSKVPNTASSGVENSKLESEMVKQSSLQVKAETSHAAEEVGIDISRPKTLSSLRNSADGHSDAVPCNTRGETKSHAPPQTHLHQSMEKKEELSKPELKPLRSLLSDKDEQDMTEVKIDRKKEAESRSLRSIEQSLGQNDADKGVKKQDGPRSSNSKRVTKVASQGSPTDQRDGIGRSRAKGTVKEFIKIFNQGAPLKPKVDVRPQGGSFRRNERGGKVDDLADHTNIGVERQVKVSHVGTTNTIPETSNHTSNHNVNQFHKQTDREHSGRSTASFLFSDGSSEEKNSSASSTESAPEDARPTDIEIDESFSGNFVLKELPQDEDKQRQPSEELDDIIVIDAKIRQWSRGKEGNIRSLLSTLQYVLWPKSGWKPVPLVDIIEGPAVKRAYQKALLCLHPDKLQQKGAASHQKYIAEQVFDILQESWTHFNSLGSV
ncbi:J domain-containing protein required for chloroplast accumulation response 1 isoform X2 [Syzygium oleosum]|uniref:J domain-containing protein required for chloroplast accumulation response 1 isoform X2 n=1 Tax=Syzygium oleosum TaxID=219896 RepID=UPI0011D281C4|nr:J domain-containing protein required for chloroplast accumulation response 1 isoform X2 [Syzygium oleosum]